MMAGTRFFMTKPWLGQKGTGTFRFRNSLGNAQANTQIVQRNYDRLLQALKAP
jgi:hypothetical protein